MNHDLRTTPENTSQRLLNAQEVGTYVPIHRHLKTSKTVICIEGCLDWVSCDELTYMPVGQSITGKQQQIILAYRQKNKEIAYQQETEEYYV